MQTVEVMLLHIVRYIYLPAVLKSTLNVDSPERLAELVDFTFNLGIGRLKKSILRKRVNVGDWAAAAVEVING
jgi:lysozyme